MFLGTNKRTFPLPCTWRGVVACPAKYFGNISNDENPLLAFQGSVGTVVALYFPLSIVSCYSCLRKTSFFAEFQIGFRHCMWSVWHQSSSVAIASNHLWRSFPALYDPAPIFCLHTERSASGRILQSPFTFHVAVPIQSIIKHSVSKHALGILGLELNFKTRSSDWVSGASQRDWGLSPVLLSWPEMAVERAKSDFGIHTLCVVFTEATWLVTSMRKRMQN